MQIFSKNALRYHRYIDGIDLYGTQAEIEVLRGALDSLRAKSKIGAELIADVGQKSADADYNLTVYHGPIILCKCARCKLRPLDMAYHIPDHSLIYTPDAWMPKDQLWWVNIPIEVGLAHELVHAWRAVSGKACANLMIEETATVGLGPYAGEKFSENAVRRELGLPIRERY